jgi:hypothetical protein
MESASSRHSMCRKVDNILNIGTAGGNALPPFRALDYMLKLKDSVSRLKELGRYVISNFKIVAYLVLPSSSS